MKYFAYCRKSSEGEERQALSIPAQIDEIKRVFGDTGDVEIVEWFEEKMSAKAPGRPIWSSVIKRIERGEADGIVAWHPDRLARNSVDGGWIIHLLDRRILKDLKFVSYSYEQSPQGMFMLQIMFGQSKYYVDNLSVNVKRGMRKKIATGWWANLAPLGYKNDRETGTIVVDSERFHLLRRAWDLLLTDTYTVSQIRDILNNQWGFRTPKHKKRGGGPLALSTVYKVFKRPFYAGVLDWCGEWRPGKHPPMITLEEFHRSQKILGQPGHPKPETHLFAYTGGLIHCVCGLSVTGEEKVKPSGKRYIYYRCTRRSRQGRCPQPPARVETIENAISELLHSIQLPAGIEERLLRKLHNSKADQQAYQDQLVAAGKQSLAQVQKELKVLVDLRIREMIDDAEFVERRQNIQRQEMRLHESVERKATEPPFWLELWHSVILFRKYAADWFLAGETQDKRLVLKTVGLNSVLGDRKLNIQARFPFQRIENPAYFPRWCAIVEALGTQVPEKEAEFIIEAVAALQARAEARRAGTPVPPLSPSLSKQQSARTS